MKKKVHRRDFITAISLGGLGFSAGIPHISNAFTENSKPAILGGQKLTAAKFPGWPIIDQTEEKALLDVLQSKGWCRLGNHAVSNFENQYRTLTGARHCLGVSSGTSALYTALGAMNIGPGDEVVLPVYTFVATYNVVVLHHALPVFVDTDIETFQIDSSKVESAITRQTKVIMPVHIGGSPANLDQILSVANKNNTPVIEDACQAHMAEWRGRKVGTWGLAGAFSFQASKNLNSGEGGAVITNDDHFAQACYDFHNQGQGDATSYFNGETRTRGTNLRLTEFQGNLLIAQMTRLREQTDQRTENADYLTGLLNEIPGIKPAKLYDGVTRSAYHLYMFRYDKNEFAGLERNGFIEALRAEGVPCSGGYGTLNTSNYVRDLAKDRHYLRIYGEKKMNQWLERNQCPQNDRLCQEAVWFSQTMLLGSRSDIDMIAAAIRRIRKNAGGIAK